METLSLQRYKQRFSSLTIVTEVAFGKLACPSASLRACLGALTLPGRDACRAVSTKASIVQ